MQCASARVQIIVKRGTAQGGTDDCQARKSNVRASGWRGQEASAVRARRWLARLSDPWHVVVLLVSILCAVYLVEVAVNWGGSSVRPLLRDAGLLPAGFVATLLTWRAAKTHADRQSRRPWLLATMGFACFFVGDVLYFVYRHLLGQPAFPSLADVAFLGCYPLLLASILSFPNTFRDRLHTATFGLDELAIGLSGGMVISYFLLLPTLGGPRDNALILSLSIAYPIGDLLLLLGVGYLLLRDDDHRATFSLLLLSLSLLVCLASNLVFGYQSIQKISQPREIPGAGYMVAWVLIAWAGLVEARRAKNRIERGWVVPGWLRGTLPCAFVAAGVGLLVYVAISSSDHTIKFVAMGVAVLILVVVLRQVLMFHEAKHLQARFRSLVTNSSDAVLVMQPDTTLTYASPAATHVLGYSPSQLQGRRLLDLVHPNQLNRVAARIEKSSREARSSHRGVCRLRDALGEWRDTEVVLVNLLNDENVRGLVVTARDVGERLRLQRELEHHAFHDSLTDLANRALFVNRVEHSLERAARSGQNTAVIFIDVDDFQMVNQSLGRGNGDALLVQIAQRLNSFTRSSDTAARLAGDEFAILLEDAPDVFEVSRITKRLVGLFQDPFVLESTVVPTSVSVGIAMCDGAQLKAEELLGQADTAVYWAKARGKNRVEVFEATMQEAIRDRLQLETDLRQGIEQRQFRVHYQPIFEIGPVLIVGVEALVRWEHPTRGLVMPGDFIGAAEATDLITQIGYQVLEQACVQAHLWEGLLPERPITMSVNLSPRQIRDPQLVLRVRDLLRNSGIEPGRLTFEITESVLLDDSYPTLERLNELKRLGIKLTVDDFGTGYSSLAYLQKFPLDGVKIARPFVDTVLDGPEQEGLVRAIIGIGEALHLEVVAEGIERREQLEKLRALGCKLGQGYYVSRPLQPDAITALLLQSEA